MKLPWNLMHTLDDIAREIAAPLTVVLITGLIVVAWACAALYLEMAWSAWTK